MSRAKVAGGNADGTRAGSSTKRKADESSLGDSDRFFKRFHLLSLAPWSTDTAHSLYIPVAKPTTTDAPAARAATHARHSQNDSMHVDDTRDRVYIHDLDEELAGIEDEEPRLIFLPDIEKQLSRLPRQVLTGKRDNEHDGQELVLYGLPKSLTVDEGHDSVRKAILETRQRARAKAVEGARHHDMNYRYEQRLAESAAETAHGYGGGYTFEQDEEPPPDADPDAMDMD